MPIQFVDGRDEVEFVDAAGTAVRLNGSEFRAFLAERFRESHLRKLALDCLVEQLGNTDPAVAGRAAALLLGTSLNDPSPTQFLQVRDNRR